MTWIAYVLDVMVLFTPGIGLSKVIQNFVSDGSLSVPLLESASVEVKSAVVLSLSNLALGSIALLVLLLLDKRLKSILENGFIYAMRPHRSNYLAVFLAETGILFVGGLSIPLNNVIDLNLPFETEVLMPLMLISWLTAYIYVPRSTRGNDAIILRDRVVSVARRMLEAMAFTGLASYVAERLWEVTLGRYVITQMLGTLSSSIGLASVIPFVVLCVLTLVAAVAFSDEQSIRYRAALAHNRLWRKKHQAEIVIPNVKNIAIPDE